MAGNQEAVKRYRIIHSILRRGGYHKSSRIAEVCREAGIRAEHRTIQNDLNDLRTNPTLLGKCLPIEKDNLTKSWYYSEIPTHMFPILELEGDEINALLFYVKTVNHYKEYPFFSKISKAIKKVIDNSNISKEIRSLFNAEGYLQTDKHHPISGIDLIAQILNCIHNKIILEIE